ncbi:MAG: hypothetical protein JKY48_03120 [Flavobacteriales bacterium]|nr:hypothetical protein [Flavobacteriales bacterium]
MNTKNEMLTTSIDPSNLLGTWINTYGVSKNISSFELVEKHNQIILSATGADNGVLPGAWGETVCIPLAKDPEKDVAVALLANYKLDFMNASLSINMNKGILIIAGSCTFIDGSGRSDYYFREFYFLK